MIFFPNCKINLGLHILQKRSDGFHDIETVFYPVALRDALEIIQEPTPSRDLTFTTSGIPIDGDAEDNICLKAYRLLKKDFPQLPSIKLHLHKTIPLGAGLGGGSSNGTFTLLLLNKKFNLGLSEEMLSTYALQLGSDCPFFVSNKPCFATGRGEQLQPVAIHLERFKIVLINPGIHVNTGWAFSRIKASQSRPSLLDIVQQPVEQWKGLLTNDFEEAVFSEYPETKKLKEELYKQGAVYASMSGSGSTVFGLFPKDGQVQFEFPSSYFIKLV